MKINKNKIRNILVIRTDRMGDVLLNIPAIRALKQTFNASVTALFDSSVTELFTGSQEIDKLMPFDAARWKNSAFFRWEFLRRLRRGGFDLAVVFNPAKRMHILAYFSGIPLRLGYNRKWGFLLTHKIEDKKFRGEKHEVEYNLDLVRSIGADTTDKDITIPRQNGDERFVDSLLAEHGVASKDLLVAIHPHSSNPAKCWPKERFVQVAGLLHQRFAAKVIIIGGEEEQAAGAEMVSKAACPALNLAGKLTWKQLAAFLRRCRLLISNDSGPAHIAAAVKTPAVVIFGRNIPGAGPLRWRPWGEGNVVLHKNPGCNPCWDRDCPYDFKCLTAITPEEVLQVVEEKLENSALLH